MFARIEITIKASKVMDLSKSAEEIHREIFKTTFKALEEIGFSPQLEELTLKESDVLEAMRGERRG